jgi:hypothetical protein
MTKIEQKQLQLEEWENKLNFLKEKEAQTSDLKK